MQLRNEVSVLVLIIIISKKNINGNANQIIHFMFRGLQFNEVHGVQLVLEIRLIKLKN